MKRKTDLRDNIIQLVIFTRNMGWISQSSVKRISDVIREEFRKEPEQIIQKKKEKKEVRMKFTGFN